MVKAVTATFGKHVLMLSDMGVTPVFAAPCGFESLTMTMNFNTNQVNIPDCDDPDLPGWLATDVASKQMTVSGQGVLDLSAMETWQDWWFTTEDNERDMRWFRNLPAADGGGYFQGPATLTAYEESGQRGQRWQVSVAVAFNGKPTWTAAA